MRQSECGTTAETAFFAEQLERYGPNRNNPNSNNHRLALEDCRKYCKWFAKRQYENFTVVSFLLPRRIRQDFYNIYAYCRWSDDLADEVASTASSLELLQWWRTELALCTEGEPSHPIMLALQQTIRDYDIPIHHFSDLISAFEQDQQVFRYQTSDELLDYCRRSANPVGRILLRLGDCDSESNLEASDQICTGLQIANFCQDMARDAKINRIYAPAELLAKFHIEEEQVLASKATEPLKAFLREWVTLTKEYFHSGWHLIQHVPGWLATDVDLFVRGGLATLESIEKQDFDVWTRRPTLSKPKKLALMAQSLASRLKRSRR